MGLKAVSLLLLLLGDHGCRHRRDFRVEWGDSRSVLRMDGGGRMSGAKVGAPDLPGPPDLPAEVRCPVRAGGRGAGKVVPVIIPMESSSSGPLHLGGGKMHGLHPSGDSRQYSRGGDGWLPGKPVGW